MRNTMEQINITYIAIESETEKALQVRFENRTEWMPKSQVTINDDNTITMPAWMANKKHLIERVNSREESMYAKMRKEVEDAKANKTDEEMKADAKDALHRKIYSHYDKRSGEYYAIDVNGKRHNA